MAVISTLKEPLMLNANRTQGNTILVSIVSDTNKL
jgi:hypothetical protein